MAEQRRRRARELSEMQYPQIQFYKGSLVRLANGRLKQVEDLSSDDFLESARLALEEGAAQNQAKQSPNQPGLTSQQLNRSTLSLSNACDNQQQSQQQQQSKSPFDFRHINANVQRLNGGQNGGSSGTLDENNNSVFNSPEPTSASYDDSPRMEAEDYDDDDEDIDVELDVVTNDDQEPAAGLQGVQQVSELVNRAPTSASKLGKLGENRQVAGQLGCDFYVDSSVVRDFLEVGPIQQQMARGLHGSQPPPPPSSSSPASSTGSLTQQDQHLIYSLPSTSISAHSSNSNSLQHNPSNSPPAFVPQITSAAPPTTTHTVLIKFFLETSRSVAFIEVPIEHPFFVLHRGWSSWNPQTTYDKFGLKCRKLKIGDTCISLIRRQTRQPSSHNDSDQCNILFSSIKINE